MPDNFVADSLDIEATLRQRFGFDTFRPGQAEAIRNLLGRHHALVVMPTGAGKSLIYQLAALHQEGLTLVISPLIALMKDQVDVLTGRGIPAACIHSALPSGEQAQCLRALAEGSLRLVYVSPERLRNVAFRRALRTARVGLLAVDEAHCISECGHDFRPDYLHIATARKAMGDPLTVSLTATATPRVQDEIVRLLALGSAKRIVTGFNRPNLRFDVRYGTDLNAKFEALRNLFGGLDGGAALVYVGTRRDAVEVADFLRSVVGVRAEHYHAGVAPETRVKVQESFLGGDLPAVVATNAFGMGIDRPDIRLVAHFAMPGTLEAYYQEAGRAGRDGKPARAVLLYDPSDRALQEWFIENDAPGARDLRMLYDAVCGLGDDAAWTSVESLSRDTGCSEVMVKLALAQLEEAGSLERLGDEGARMLVRVGLWNEASIREAATRTGRRREFCRGQLDRMVAYAEANTCRRRILLDHFGDASTAEALECCDNCLQNAEPVEAARSMESLTDRERIPLAILDAIRQMKWEVGKKKLVQILKGSRAKDMQQFGYDGLTYYGRLSDLPRGEIEDLATQLIGDGYIKVVGGDRPLLRLTPRGETAIRRKARISLRFPGGRSTSRKRVRSRQTVPGASVAITAAMFGQGLTPGQVAEARVLAPSTVYSHLARRIAEGKIPLLAVVVEHVAAQVRDAIEQVGSAEALASIRALLPEEITFGEIRCVAEDWKRHQNAAPNQATDAVDEVEAFLSRSHPVPLAGPWDAGWSLGFHSRFYGGNWCRSEVGELTYRLKYRGDLGALPVLVQRALEVIEEHPELAHVDAIVPIPPSTERERDPAAEFARALGERVGLPVWPLLRKTRQTAPQKETAALAQKRANVQGAIVAQRRLYGKSLLLLDDLYDSGATLEEAARVLRRAGASGVYVLTMTSTIHSDA